MQRHERGEHKHAHYTYHPLVNSPDSLTSRLLHAQDADISSPHEAECVSSHGNGYTSGYAQCAVLDLPEGYCCHQGSWNCDASLNLRCVDEGYQKTCRPPHPPPHPPPSPPPSSARICLDSCYSLGASGRVTQHNNGICSDGGEGSGSTVFCDIGHDCTDCGTSNIYPPPMMSS